MLQCATCAEVFIDEETYDKHLLTHAQRLVRRALGQLRPRAQLVL